MVNCMHDKLYFVIFFKGFICIWSSDFLFQVLYFIKYLVCIKYTSDI